MKTIVVLNRKSCVHQSLDVHSRSENFLHHEKSKACKSADDSMGDASYAHSLIHDSKMTLIGEQGELISEQDLDGWS